MRAPRAVRAIARLALAALLGCGVEGDPPAHADGASSGGPTLASGGRADYASFSHHCAVAAGRVQCWGAGHIGQLGDARVPRWSPLPVRAGALAEAVAVAAGDAFTCSIAGGRVFCWGDNTRRQIGVEGPWIIPEPARVEGLPEPVDTIAAGGEHACAVAAGEVFCWGRSEHGQLGTEPREICLDPGKPLRCRAAPERVAGLPGAVEALALGASHSCALAAGAVHCWGRNHRGQLGDGRTRDRIAPVAVGGLAPPVAAIAAAGDATCAIAAGALYCWGALPGAESDARRPTPVSGLDAVERVAMGPYATCAKTAAELRCWGRPGGPDAARALAPPGARIEGVEGRVAALSVGADSACAALAGAEIACWGQDDWGQRGRGRAARGAPAEVLRATRVAAFDQGVLRDVDGDGRIAVACLGDSNTERAPGQDETWCEALESALEGRVVTVNRGWGGATAVSEGSLFPAREPVDYALAQDAPEVVILAYGTNDVTMGAPVEAVVAALRRHRARAAEAGAEAFVALVPPVLLGDAGVERRRLALNAALREAFPADRLVDFASGFGDADFRDALHVNASGQRKRARAAASALRAALPPGDP